MNISPGQAKLGQTLVVNVFIDGCFGLKNLLPDLFVHPSLRREKEEWGIPMTPCRVTQPLAGEDLYIVPEEFTKYMEAVKEFWDELGKAFDRLE